MSILRWISETFFDKEFEPCDSCLTLKEQLRVSNNEKRDLHDRILQLTAIKDRPLPPDESDKEPIGKTYIPWHARQAQLEEADRAKMKALKRNREELGEVAGKAN